MTRLLLLGATGRTGSSILRQLSENDHIQVTTAIRDVSDSSRCLWHPRNVGNGS